MDDGLADFEEFFIDDDLTYTEKTLFDDGLMDDEEFFIGDGLADYENIFIGDGLTGDVKMRGTSATMASRTVRRLIDDRIVDDDLVDVGFISQLRLLVRRRWPGIREL